MACVLDPPQVRPEQIASPAERMTIREALKHLVQIRNVALRTFITPSRPSVHTDVNEVTACAATQLEAGHCLRLRVLTGTLCADLGQNATERGVLGYAARIPFINCRSQRV